MTGPRVLRARKILCLDAEGTEAEWVVVSDGFIGEIGRGDPPGDSVIELDGVLAPGFIDAHVHLTTTGLYRTGLDLSDARSVPEALDSLAGHLRSSEEPWVIGGNFDPGRNPDPRMPHRAELDRVAGDRKVLISRADGHSCVLSSEGLRAAGLEPTLEGFLLDEAGQPTGVLRHEANYAARRKVFSTLPAEQVGRAQRSACEAALEVGVTSVHEMAGGSYMGDRDFELMLEGREGFPIHVVIFLATLDVERALRAGLGRVGGDLFLDGSIGSRTAAMGEPYEDEEGKGFLYHSEEEVAGFFEEATRARIQAGVHAIGDAAVGQALSCLEEVSSRLGDGAEGVAPLRHRIEHIECADEAALEAMARLGVIPSVQPTFDYLWGGLDGMYAARLGERAKRMNPFGTMVRMGLEPAGGSDSTVTELDPLLGIHSAVNHQTPEFSVTVDQALRMFTTWAAAAAHEEHVRGSIETGKTADFALLEKDPADVDPDEIRRIEVLGTWVAGEEAWRAG